MRRSTGTIESVPATHRRRRPWIHSASTAASPRSGCRTVATRTYAHAGSQVQVTYDPHGARPVDGHHGSRCEPRRTESRDAVCAGLCYLSPPARGYSSAGRASEWHSEGQGFEPPSSTTFPVTGRSSDPRPRRGGSSVPCGPRNIDSGRTLFLGACRSARGQRVRRPRSAVHVTARRGRAHEPEPPSLRAETRYVSADQPLRGGGSWPALFRRPVRRAVDRARGSGPGSLRPPRRSF